jgi:uncharacterized protein (TIGR02001 family)
MGIVMKKLVLVAATLAMTAGSAFAADLPTKAAKIAPVPAFDPWDVAFGSAIMSDYVFRGITQSDHKASVAAYFEPRYNVNKDFQLYIGVSSESISFPNRAAAEVDIYGGVRPTIGIFAFDFGIWGYFYPGGQCFGGGGTQLFPATNSCFAFNQGTDFGLGAGLPINGNFAKRDASFFEGYAKVNITVTDQFVIGLNEYYSPNFLNVGAWGDYASITGKWTAPSTTFGASGLGMYVSGEFGRQWLGKSDAFYGTTSAAFLGNAVLGGPFPLGIPEPSYNTWNIGIGFTYKVFTLDLRYSDTDLNKGKCNALTSDYSTTSFNPGNISAINPGGFGSNWCGSTGIAKLSADLTAMTNLK